MYSFHRIEHFISSGAFKTNEEEKSEEVFKSVGIDKEGGLVFTLDTLQVHVLMSCINRARRTLTLISGVINNITHNFRLPN